MGIQLNKQAYEKLIDENINALEKYMPKFSLEKKHTIEVLKWSVNQIYESKQVKSLNENDIFSQSEDKKSVCNHDPFDYGFMIQCKKCKEVLRTHLDSDK